MSRPCRVKNAMEMPRSHGATAAKGGSPASGVWGKMTRKPLAIRMAATMASISKARERGYDEEPERRSLVPILAVVAGVLGLAVVIVVILFATGFFNRGPAP